MSLYKTKIFSTFKNGEIQQDYSDNPDMSFSNKIALSLEKKVKLGWLFEKNAISNSYAAEQADQAAASKNIYPDFTMLSLVITQPSGVDHAMLYKMNGTAVPTLVKDFGAGTARALIVFGNVTIVTYFDDTAGYAVWKYTTDLSTWTEITNMRDESFLNWEIHDDELYIIVQPSGAYGKIWKSTDGKSFAVLQATAPVYKIISCNGFLYGVGKNTYRLENGAWTVIEKKYSATMHRIGSKLRMITDGRIYEFDGESWVKVRDIHTYTYFEGSSETKTYFAVETPDTGAGDSPLTYDIYSYDNEGILLKEVRLESLAYDGGLCGVFEDPDGTIWIQHMDYLAFEMAWYSNKNRKFISQGDFETTLVNEGLIVPKALYIKHKPLATGSCVKIYHSFDFASSFTLVMQSNSVGAVKKNYIYPSGTKIDFAKFKVELITSDPTQTPEDIQLEFLYSPLGLENSK